MREKKILFRCCTFYQLINAINIKLSFLKNDYVDLILNSATDFSDILESLEEENIFNHVAIMEDSIADNREFRSLDRNAKKSWIENIEENIYQFPYEDIEYTDYYIAINDEYNTICYYYLVKKGLSPNVHIFEESKATYVLSIMSSEKKDGIPHSSFGNKNMYRCIKEILLYEPEYYKGDKINCFFTKIPKIDGDDVEVQHLYTNIFGSMKLPNERYIYLVGPFFWDKFTSSEMDVIDEFAEIVGKENMILKMHPRDQIDRYSERGYKVLENTKIPWEIVMLNNNMEKHVLISISSNASLTAQMIFGKEIYSLHLEELMFIGKDHRKLELFRKFDDYLFRELNFRRKYLFKPLDLDQLIEIVKYIERKMNFDGEC